MITRTVNQEMPLLSPTTDNLVALDKNVVNSFMAMLDKATLEEKVESFARALTTKFQDGQIKNTNDLWEEASKQIILGQSLDIIQQHIETVDVEKPVIQEVKVEKHWAKAL